MFQNTNSLRNPRFRGFWVHSLKTSDKVLRYGENNQVEFYEHTTVVQRGNERTFNIYAAILDVGLALPMSHFSDKINVSNQRGVFLWQKK